MSVPELRRWRLKWFGQEATSNHRLVTRQYKGQTIVAKVLKDGVEYDGRKFSSLSAVAQEVTGVKWNGSAFFDCSTRNLAKNSHEEMTKLRAGVDASPTALGLGDSRSLN